MINISKARPNKLHQFFIIGLELYYFLFEEFSIKMKCCEVHVVTVSFELKLVPQNDSSPYWLPGVVDYMSRGSAIKQFVILLPEVLENLYQCINMHKHSLLAISEVHLFPSYPGPVNHLSPIFVS